MTAPDNGPPRTEYGQHKYDKACVSVNRKYRPLVLPGDEANKTLATNETI